MTDEDLNISADKLVRIFISSALGGLGIFILLVWTWVTTKVLVFLFSTMGCYAAPYSIVFIYIMLIPVYCGGIGFILLALNDRGLL